MLHSSVSHKQWFVRYVQERLDAAGGLAAWKSRDSVKPVQQWLRKFNPRMACVLMDERDQARQTLPRPLTRLSLCHLFLAMALLADPVVVSATRD